MDIIVRVALQMFSCRVSPFLMDNLRTFMVGKSNLTFAFDESRIIAHRVFIRNAVELTVRHWYLRLVMMMGSDIDRAAR